MRPMTGLPLALLVALATQALALPCFGQPNKNAATWYQRAIDSINRLSPEQREAIDAYRAQPSLPPTPEVRAALARAQMAMSMARRGARQHFADYELDYDQGFSLVLPHLAVMRQMARTMQADAYVKLHDGDVAGASDRVATMFRMAEHTGHDRIVISSLVAQAIWHTGDETLQAILDRGVIDPGEAAIVLRAATDMPTNDPFSYVEASIMEQEIAVATLRRAADEGEDGLVQLAPMLGEGDEVAAQLRGLTEEDVVAGLDEYSELMTQVTEIFVEGDPEAGRAELDEIDKAMEAGEFGILCRLFMPAMGLCFDRKLEMEERIAERIETLERLAAGESALEEGNAAIWYLAAIEAMQTLEKLDEQAMTALRRVDRERKAELDEHLVAGLDSAEKVLDLVRQASTMKRCDFTHARNAALRAPEVAPSYAPGLRDLLRLVLVDARRRLDAGKRDAAIDRLRLAWSMVIHLQTDPMFATAIMNHIAFSQAVQLTKDGRARGVLTADDQKEFAMMTARIRRTDPFGFVAAVVEARAALWKHYWKAIWFTQENLELRARVEKDIKTLDGDRLLAIAVVMDTMRHARDEDFAAHKAKLDPLGDVYDLEMIEATRGDVPRIAPIMAANDIATLRDMTPPDIADLKRRAMRARADLRAALRDLAPPKPAVAGEKTEGEWSGADPEQDVGGPS